MCENLAQAEIANGIKPEDLKLNSWYVVKEKLFGAGNFTRDVTVSNLPKGFNLLYQR